jgi:hypothetical protein
MVDPDEVNELDIQTMVDPIPMFPGLSAKIDALRNFWDHRWDSK